MNIDNMKNESILDGIYLNNQEELGIVTQELKERLNQITIEKVQEQIKFNIQNKEKEEIIERQLEALIENYEIKMGYYIEKAYKKGFKDAFLLFLECYKK